MQIYKPRYEFCSYCQLCSEVLFNLIMLKQTVSETVGDIASCVSEMSSKR